MPARDDTTRTQLRRYETHRRLGFLDETTGGCGPAVVAAIVGLVALVSLWSAGVGAAIAAAVVAMLSVVAGGWLTRSSRRHARMSAWRQLLAEAGLRGIDVAGLQPTNRGLLVQLELSATITFPVVARATERVEVAAGLGRGGVRVERGRSAGTVWLHARIRGGDSTDRLPLPADDGNRTVATPLPIGVHEDGDTCAVRLGHRNVLMVEAVGGSVDELVRVVVAQLARCVDTLVWVATPSGVRMLSPWLDAGRPAVDWVAADLDEVELMVDAALTVARRRDTTGLGGDRWVPTADLPALTVIVPDAAVVLHRDRSPQHQRIADMVTELARVGPRQAVTVAVGLTADSSAGSGLAELRQACDLRIGLGQVHAVGAWRMFPDAVMPDRDALSGPGSVLLHQTGGGRVLPAWLFWVDRGMARRVAVECAHRRPVLEHATEAALGGVYATRWDRWRAARAGTDLEFRRIVDHG